MTTVIAALFFLASVAVAVLGFASVRSDIQIIIGLLGALFAGVFLAVVFLAAKIDAVQRAVEDIEPEVRKDAARDFNAAVLLYQKHGGHQEAGSALRELAAEALRQKGFLR